MEIIDTVGFIYFFSFWNKKPESYSCPAIWKGGEVLSMPSSARSTQILGRVRPVCPEQWF